MIALVKCGMIGTYMASVTGQISDTWQVVGPRTERRSEFLRQRYTCVDEQKKKKALKKRCQKRDAIRGLPRWSPILVLLSPKHASLRSSDGIRCISAAMITALKYGVISTYMASVTGLISNTWKVVGPRTERRGEFHRRRYTCVGEHKKKKALKKRCQKRGATRGLPRRSPILVLLSPKHA